MARSARRPDPRFSVRVLGDATRTYDDPTGLADDVVIENVVLAGVDWSGRRAHLVDLAECRWDHASLNGATTTRLSAVDQRFDVCDLSVWRAEDAALTRLAATGCRMSGLTWSGATVQQAELTDCTADLAVLRGATLSQVRFDSCRLSEADFGSAVLDRVVFRECDLRRAEFHNAHVKAAWLIDCVLDDVRGLAALRGATIAFSDPLDALALVGPMAAALGIGLAEPQDLVGHP